MIGGVIGSPIGGVIVTATNTVSLLATAAAKMIACVTPAGAATLAARINTSEALKATPAANASVLGTASAQTSTRGNASFAVAFAARLTAELEGRALPSGAAAMQATGTSKVNSRVVSAGFTGLAGACFSAARGTAGNIWTFLYARLAQAVRAVGGVHSFQSGPSTDAEWILVPWEQHAIVIDADVSVAAGTMIVPAEQNVLTLEYEDRSLVVAADPYKDIDAPSEPRSSPTLNRIRRPN